MDTSVLAFLAAPFVASLILTGIHAYLGVHVVERGVIFVDLSLAQIAALGATIALLIPGVGGDPHAPFTYWVSLAFTFLGALVFSTIRSRRARIPQEAIIGICYAVASAAAILAMSKATSESEHLKDMLVGNILAVSWTEVGKTAVLYGAIGIFHYIFRHKFLAISMDPKKAEAAGISLKLWDFLFYASFGSFRGRHAVRGHDRTPARNRLDDGNGCVGFGGLSFIAPRSANRRDNRLHIWACAGHYGGSTSSAPADACH